MKNLLLAICLFASIGAIAQDTTKVANAINNGNRQPIYIVDGVKTDSAKAMSINPKDIERMDVVKDASATALYGKEGTNGVILITTKAGSKKNQPVYIIDGVKADVAKFKALNPDDIESVNISKDASEAALHSTEGKNGVVTVITKAAAKKAKEKSKN
ncbi:MAG: TonB-dependent receptor plug domain-containing protein [Mucilaginibacter sp.]|nr:TonB-dependent receptor plug domain-containing protein [Mucilaginibacter sp.]